MTKGDVQPVTYTQKHSMDNRGFQEDGGSVVINMKQSTNGINGSSATRARSNKAVDRKVSITVAATLSAHNVDYSVKVKEKFYKAATDKQILHNVTAVFGQGMNAILGPSGCGKSTFLDLLAGRVDEENVKGTLLLDSKPTPKNFKCMVGYVVQDDVIMGTLTVRENFAFSAALRLPNSVTEAERKARIEDTIRELGLTSCADTKVGNELIRGVSGGQRKRCNIGMELIIRPPVLFLDEPTTGLDANTASTVLMFLKKLSERGRTIIFSIHQPRYSIYRLFDNVLLLSAGHTIYHGPGLEALTFFQQQGYSCQEHNNPPDFFLDVINGDPSTLGIEDGDDDEYDEDDTVAKERKEKQIKEKHDALVEGFKNSSWNKSLQDEASVIYSSYKELYSKPGHSVERIDYATSFMTQMGVLSKRTIKNVVRNPQSGMATMMSIIFFSLISTAIFHDLTNDPKRAINDRKGVLFFVMMNQIMLNMASVEVFIGERKFFLHENITGFYRVSVYFFVKIFCDILPLRLLPVIIQACIVYYPIGFRNSAEAFFRFVLTMFTITASATGLCFLYSSVFKVFSVTQLLVSMTYIVMLLFSGFLVNLSSISDWLEWLKYFSFVKYGLENLLLSEFKDASFCVLTNSSNANSSHCAHGNDFLDTSGITYSEEWDYWQNIIVNTAFAVGFLLLTYVNLRLTKKHR